MKSQKILVTLLERLTHKQIFGIIWVVMFVGFAYLFYQFQKKRDQRNFREGSNVYPRTPIPKLSEGDEKNLPEKRDNRLPHGK